LSTLGPHLHIVDAGAFGTIARRLLDVPWWTMWGSAVVAGWLMGLLAWLMAASRDTIGQIVFVSVTTFLIGIAGFHHSIAGTIEVLLALLAGAGPTWADYGRFISASAEHYSWRCSNSATYGRAPDPGELGRQAAGHPTVADSSGVGRAKRGGDAAEAECRAQSARLRAGASRTPGSAGIQILRRLRGGAPERSAHREEASHRPTSPSGQRSE